MARVPFKLKSGNSIPFKQMGIGSSDIITPKEEETTPKKRSKRDVKVGPLAAWAAQRLSEMGEGKFAKTMGEVAEGSGLYKNIKALEDLSRMAKAEGEMKVAGDVLKGKAQFLPGAERRHAKKIKSILDAPAASGYGTKYGYKTKDGKIVKAPIITGPTTSSSSATSGYGKKFKYVAKGKMGGTGADKPRISKVKINGGGKAKIKAGGKGGGKGFWGGLFG